MEQPNKISAIIIGLTMRCHLTSPSNNNLSTKRIQIKDIQQQKKSIRNLLCNAIKRLFQLLDE